VFHRNLQLNIAHPYLAIFQFSSSINLLFSNSSSWHYSQVPPLMVLTWLQLGEGPEPGDQFY
jgi:hypothetical protein